MRKDKVNGQVNNAAVVIAGGSASITPVVAVEHEINEAVEMFSAADVQLEMPSEGSIIVQVDASATAQPGSGYTNRLGELYGKVAGVLNLNLAVKLMKTVKETGAKVVRQFGPNRLPHFRLKIEHTPDAGSDPGKRAVVVVPGVYTYPTGHPQAGRQVQMFFKVLKQVQTLELEPLTAAERDDYLKAQNLKAKINRA